MQKGIAEGYRSFLSHVCFFIQVNLLCDFMSISTIYFQFVDLQRAFFAMRNLSVFLLELSEC